MHIIMGLFYCVCNEHNDSDCSVIAVPELLWGPEQKPGVSDFFLMSGTVTDLRQSFGSLFVFVLSFFSAWCFCSLRLVIFLLTVLFSNFFSRKVSSIKREAFLYGPC